MRNVISEKIKKGAAIATVAGILFSFSGCGTVSRKLEISDDATLESVLSDISSCTKLDDNIEKLSYNGIGFQQLIDGYNFSRENEDFAACQDILYQLCYLILMESTAEVLDIDIDKITSFGVSWDEDDNYNILIKFLDEEDLISEKSFYLSGNGIEMAEILKKCLDSRYMSLEEFDDDYDKCVDFLLTNGYIVNETIVFSYNDEKVKVYEKNTRY